ncbi:hypothetical protein F2P79_005831 [Pimephales promelas]|nr:hypothetical protein F2P79_005831 [Pimephales promelas]
MRLAVSPVVNHGCEAGRHGNNKELNSLGPHSYSKMKGQKILPKFTFVLHRRRFETTQGQVAIIT